MATNPVTLEEKHDAGNYGQMPGGGAMSSPRMTFNPITGKWEAGYGNTSPGSGGLPIGPGSGGPPPTPMPSPTYPNFPPPTPGLPTVGAPTMPALPGGSGWLSSLSAADWAKLGLSGYGMLTSGGGSQGGGLFGLGGAGAPGYLNSPFASAAGNAGYAQLLNILLSGGRTDPSLMNSQLAGIQRDTQSGQQMAQGLAARQGFANSGVNAAIQAALGQAGAGRQADVRAQEAQKAEERKRQDLDLLLRMLVQPQMDYTAMATGQYNANRQYNAQEKASRDAAYAEGIKMLISLFDD